MILPTGTRRRFVAAVVLLVIVVGVLSVGDAKSEAQDSTMREVGRRDVSAALPDGEGKGLVLASCTQCHSLNSTVQQRKTAEDWGRTVRDMVARGAQIQLPEIEIIAAYLAKSFPPGAPPLGGADQVQTSSAGARVDPNSPVALPEGAAKALIVRSCTECHALDRITTRRKDEAAWRASVKDMVRLGAELRPDEEIAVVAYLAQHFNRSSASVAVGAAGNDAAQAVRPTDPSQMLPDAEGKGLILATCVQCHSLRTVTAQHKRAEDWKRTVDDMVARGAQLTRTEAEIAANYLASSLPAEKK